METDLVTRAHRHLLLALLALLLLTVVPVARADDTVTPVVPIGADAVQAANDGGGVGGPSATNIAVTIVIDSPGAVVNTTQVAVAVAAPAAPAPPHVETPAPPTPPTPTPPTPPAVHVPDPPTPPPSAIAAASAPQPTTTPTTGAAQPASTPAAAPSAAAAPATATAPQPAAQPGVGGGGRASDATATGGLQAGTKAHAPRPAHTRHYVGARGPIRSTGVPSAAPAAPAFPVVVASATVVVHGTPGATHGAGRAHGHDGDAQHRRAHVARVPHRSPAVPVDAPSAAAAGGLGGAPGGTMLALALVTALLLTGPAGPYELVALLRRRFPLSAGGRLERPG